MYVWGIVFISVRGVFFTWKLSSVFRKYYDSSIPSILQCFIHSSTHSLFYSLIHWSFAEKIFVKQSMMSGVWNFDQKLRLGEGGGVNHTDTKSYRHQIRLGDLTGVNRTDTKLYRHQIAKSNLVSVWFTPPPQSPSLIWCLYDLVSVQFIPHNLPSPIWCLYDLPPPPKSPSLIYPEIA